MMVYSLSKKIGTLNSNELFLVRRKHLMKAKPFILENQSLEMFYLKKENPLFYDLSCQFAVREVKSNGK